jgi:pyruvate formate lyase activating enzyme
MMNGVVFDIERCSMRDGPGIRTTVFLKGCPLSCLWCHNPESQAFAPELALFQEKCAHCRACERACPTGAHEFTGGVHVLNRDACRMCGRCVDACPTGALKRYGEIMSAEKIIETTLKDAAYYTQTGGGLTVSGGEPFAQPDFLVEILELAKRRSLHSCVETSGYARPEDMKRALPLTDLFLFDIKAAPEDHKRLTGADNGRILSNLERLMALGANVLLRCPVVPGMNDSDEHFRFLASLENAYPALRGVEILSYHDMGRGKARALGREYHVSARTADEAVKKDWKARMRAAGLSASAIDAF